MDGGDLGNNHRNFEGGTGDLLTAESLPLIDVRLLSQSELRALSSLTPSFCSSSSHAPTAGVYDDLTLKIDRSVFNESAGSRKQTFTRLRFARHPQPEKPPSPQRQIDDSSGEEQSQVASLLRSLFSVDSIQTKAGEDEREEVFEDNEGQPQFSFPIHNDSNVYQNPNIDSVKNVFVQGIPGKEIGRRRGRLSKTRNPSDGEINEEMEVKLVASSERELREGSLSLDKTCSNSGTETRYDACRPQNSVAGFNHSGFHRKIEDKEEIINLENREGTMVDLTALANIAEDPYEVELRRITERLKTKKELIGYLEQLNGEWVNAGKMKKVVKACDFGGYLPKGWKLMLYIKKKGSNLWLDCHRYISPDGHEFATCKEVSTYLQSLYKSQSKNQLNSLQSDNNTLGQQVMANESLIANSDFMDLSVLGTEIEP